MSAFWVVWCPTRDNPMLRYVDFNDAKAEAERLAATNPGREFFVLQAKTRSERRDVVTVDLDEIPF